MAVSHASSSPVRILPIVWLLVLLVALAATTPVRVEAQAASPTFVAIPDAFPEIDARAIVVMEPGVDLVLLREDEATVDALGMALLVLRDAREAGRTPKGGQGFMIPITGFVVTREVQGRTRVRLEEALSRLATAETVDLGSLGPGRRIPYVGR